jgi:putative transcriptional regulator
VPSRSSDPFDLPEFVSGADLEERDTAELLVQLGELAGPPLPAAPARERLLAAVSEVPLRYAPFFHALGELWDLPESKVRSELTRAKDPRAWRRAPLPGVRWLAIQAGPRTKGARSCLLRFSPGLRFPKHRHEGSESVLVLEGSYQDSSGRRVGPGELQVMKAGSEHSLSVDPETPCTSAIVQHGMEFTGPILRWISKLIP